MIVTTTEDVLWKDLVLRHGLEGGVRFFRPENSGTDISDSSWRLEGAPLQYFVRPTSTSSLLQSTSIFVIIIINLDADDDGSDFGPLATCDFQAIVGN